MTDFGCDICVQKTFSDTHVTESISILIYQTPFYLYFVCFYSNYPCNLLVYCAILLNLTESSNVTFWNKNYGNEFANFIKDL